MKIKTIISKDFKFSKYGGYECEWAYISEKKELLLGFQKYSSIDYLFILFEGVTSFKFSNWMLVDLQKEIGVEKEEGFLYEIFSSKKKKGVRHFLTFQTPRSSLQIFASSYRIIDDALL